MADALKQPQGSLSIWALFLAQGNQQPTERAERDGGTGYGSETSYYLSVGKLPFLGEIPTRVDGKNPTELSFLLIFFLFEFGFIGLFGIFFVC